MFFPSGLPDRLHDILDGQARGAEPQQVKQVPGLSNMFRQPAPKALQREALSGQTGTSPELILETILEARATFGRAQAWPSARASIMSRAESLRNVD